MKISAVIIARKGSKRLPNKLYRKFHGVSLIEHKIKQLCKTKVDEIIEFNGISILGKKNILNDLPGSSSNLYAKNMFNFLNNLYDKENKILKINLEDEIIEKTLIK